MYLLIAFIALILRIYLVFRDSVPFAYDMGRDLLWTKDIVFYLTPTLIGPAASIWGVYFGPFWYYFLALPLLISNGHPLSAVFATSIAVVLAGLFSFILFKEYLGKFSAFILMVLILFSSNLINISTFAFHANLLPLLTILMIYFCFLAVVKNPNFIAPAFFVTSLMFSADPAPAVVFSFVPAVVFFFYKLYKSKNLLKILILSSIAYSLPFFPQLFFELRNNFVETRSLLSYFMGDNPSLSGQLPFFSRVVNRLEVFLDFFAANFTDGNEPLAIIFLIALVTGLYRSIKIIKNEKVKIILNINLLCVLTTLFIYTIPFTVEVKNWYLYGLTIPVAFLILFSISQNPWIPNPRMKREENILVEPKGREYRGLLVLGSLFALYNFKRSKILIYLFISIYLTVNLTDFFNWEKRNLSYTDPAQLVNQVDAINMVYSDVKNQDFSVYVFTPPIYDLNYQYLFWWQGVRLKKGLPEEFTYLPDQPEYVRNKKNYTPGGKSSELIYLIVENSPENPNYSKKEWLKKFQDYKIIWDKNINGAITIQKRSK